MARIDATAVVLDLLRAENTLRATDLATALGVSRQAASRRLRQLVNEGLLVREGAARATRYRLAQMSWRYPVAGLEEDRVWRQLSSEWQPLGACTEAAGGVAQYAITEMVNNAIDHASGTQVELRCSVPGCLAIEIEDDGVGVFARLCEGRNLDTELEALQALSKGKVTTDPARHTGEGIFFSSKAVDFFELRSGRLRWMVDNLRGEQGLARARKRTGTFVRLEINPNAEGRLEAIFEAYTRDFEFVRTRTVVKLFELGTRFVSRSEAKRLVLGLEVFSEVILDFSGVEGIGQGFADELFRVFARAHPEITLLPEKMNEVVEFMVRLAQSPQP